RLVIFSIYRCSCVTTLFPYTTLFRSDANVLTGRLSGKNFDYDVDLKLVENKIKEKIAEPFNMTPEEAALGIIRIANSNMLNALKLICTRNGHNPQDFTIVAFGTGGSIHAPVLALLLGVKILVCHV